MLLRLLCLHFIIYLTIISETLSIEHDSLKECSKEGNCLVSHYIMVLKKDHQEKPEEIASKYHMIVKVIN